MAIPDVIINYWAVLAAAVASFIIGGLWYSPVLFGNAWMESGGITKKTMETAHKKGLGKSYFIAFFGGLLTAYILAHFAKYLTAQTFSEGMIAGFWIWLGFVVPILLGSVLWEGKSFRFYMINALYYLVSLEVMGGILAVWR